MSYHHIEISGYEESEVCCKDGQLVQIKGNVKHQVPLEDVASVLITAPTARLHSHFLAEASARRIPVVVCQNFRPIGIFIPVGRSTDTLLTRAQITLTQRQRTALWQKIVDVKCDNQCYFAEGIASRHALLEQMAVLCAQKNLTKEGACAHLYWTIYAEVFGLDAFCRDQREAHGINSLLNYAYAMLLTLVLQRLLCVGLDPMYGVGHTPRERATPLAYDVMEPFRPLVDYWVSVWIRRRREASSLLEVDKSYKLFLRNCFESKNEGLPPLNLLIQEDVMGLREAILSADGRSYQPWQWRTTKWDGFLSVLTFP